MGPLSCCTFHFQRRPILLQLSVFLVSPLHSLRISSIKLAFHCLCYHHKVCISPVDLSSHVENPLNTLASPAPSLLPSPFVLSSSPTLATHTHGQVQSLICFTNCTLSSLKCTSTSNLLTYPTFHILMISNPLVHHCNHSFVYTQQPCFLSCTHTHTHTFLFNPALHLLHACLYLKYQM